MGESLFELLEVKTEGEVLLVGSGEGTAGGVIPRGTFVVYLSLMSSTIFTANVYDYASVEVHIPDGSEVEY